MPLPRRGFLGALLGVAGVTAADPERLLWTPGKLISIPPRVHFPKWHHLGFSIKVDPWEAVNAQLIMYEDSVRLLDEKVRRLIHQAGGARAQFLDQKIPEGMVYAQQGPMGPLPRARLLRAYDPCEDNYLLRIDVSVKI